MIHTYTSLDLCLLYITVALHLSPAFYRYNVESFHNLTMPPYIYRKYRYTKSPQTNRESDEDTKILHQWETA